MADEAFLKLLQEITGAGLDLAALVTAAAARAERGEQGQAELLYRVWIGFNPDHPQRHLAQFNQACLLSEAGDLPAAAEVLDQALAAAPDFLPAHINLGGLLERLGRPDQAVSQWRSGLVHLAAVNPQALAYKKASLKQIGRVLSETGQLAAAEAAFLECLTLDPEQPDVLSQWLGVRMAQCRWPVLEPTEGLPLRRQMAGFQPLSLAAFADDPLLQLSLAAHYVEATVEAAGADPSLDRRHAPVAAGERRIRIGYVSSDLRDHAIGYLMAELFELHDTGGFEVFAYYCGPPSASDLTARIKSGVEHWIDISQLSDDAAAARIAADGVDILVDVNGHTRDCRTGVFARRPAPIQVNWLGYPGTMASPWHQYVIADPWIIPPAFETYYSEQVLRLACYQPNDRKRQVSPETPTREAAGLPPQGLVFCCFNGAHKINRATFERWLDILAQVEGGLLWLLDSGPEAAANLRAHAAARGIAPERIVFAPKLANRDHLARYRLADLVLDSAPYGAHTTASDALWMGVPVLTLSGLSFASRVCGSLVRSAGLPELVVEDPAAYVALAVALAADPDALPALKARLQAARASCPLFDMDRLAADLEALYRQVCAAHQAGRTPQPDLANLPAYLQAGLDLGGEGDPETYEARYRAALAARHRVRPLPADSRLWAGAPMAAPLALVAKS